MSQGFYGQHREVKRIAVSIPVAWDVTPQCLRAGTITSLSIKGCLIETDLGQPLEGKTLFLRFAVPGGKEMLLHGEVLYYLRRVGFGMEFRELSEEDKKRLQELVENDSAKQVANPPGAT